MQTAYATMRPMRTLCSAALIACFCLMTLPARTQTPAGAALQSSPEKPNAELPPGVTLPDKGSMFILDNSGKGKELLQLHATEVSSNSHAGSNFARAQVLMGPQSSIELKGLNATVHIESTRPAIYVRISSDDPELLRERVQLLKLEQKRDSRVISTHSANIWGGGQKRKYEGIPVTKVDVVKDEWLCVTPASPLPPGEYGVAFIPKDSAFFSSVVYDFDVALGEAAPEKK